MNLRNALRLAWVFSLSAARAKRAKGGRPEGLAKKPVTNVYMSIAAFTLAAAFVYFVLGSKMQAFALTALASQFCIFLPSFTIFMSMTYSLMTELSMSEETGSTDLVNWLPIQAEDFVVGSALTTIYFVSPMISILFGITFSFSLLAGSLSTWTLSAALGVLACFLGALVLEIVRGAMNRVSGSFSGVRGQGAVVLRMVLSIAIIVTISMMFNFSMMMRLVGWFSLSMEGIRFFPVLWPSMIILKQTSGDPVGTLVYSTLSGLFLIAVYSASVKVRRMYWAPTPVSLKLRPMGLSQRRRRLNYIRLGYTEVALIRKDLKSLLRRREMAYLLAIPVMMVLMGLMSTPLGVIMDASIQFEAKTTFLYQCAMAVIVLVLQTSLNAIGQEGEAFVNLVAAPVDAGLLLRAKSVAAFIPVLPVFALFAALFSHIAGVDAMTVAVLIAVGLMMLIAVCSVELAVGVRYANFSGVGRARFVSQEGRLIGLLLSIVSVGTLASPLALHYLGGYINFSTACVLAVIVALGITAGGFKIARRELEKLYEYSY